MILTCSGGSFAQNPEATPLATLVEAEKAFAGMSVRDGMKKAFLEFLAEDAVLFRPGPVNGKEVWKKAKETTASLEWWPTLAFAAASGELGYTSGPWIFTPEAHLDQPPRHGHFVTVWKKQKNGEWKVTVDLGTSGGVPDTDTALVVPPAIETKRSLNVKKEKALLLSLEKKFSAAAGSEGIQSAFKEYLSDDARVFREGDIPVLGCDAVLKKFGDSRTNVRSTVLSCVVSRSCDLAYAYGRYSSGTNSSTESGYFLRIWRKQAANVWRIALDVASPGRK
jgi:ketosteroid isomerase-like protein